MNNTAVNLGAGGFVSYFEDGGATVTLTPPEGSYEDNPYQPDLPPAEPYEEQGVGAFIADQFRTIVSDDAEGFPSDEIRASGRSNTPNRDLYYPEGQTFFEQLAERYGYSPEKRPDGTTGISPLTGRKRMEVPRSDLPKAQELEDARAHMLASAMAASQYGPETAMSIGDLNEFKDKFTPFGNAQHSAMDRRNNAIGISLFKKAGMGATAAELTKRIDNRVFEQLNVILGRTPEEQDTPPDQPKWRKNFKSPEEGPDLYFPRKKSGHFVKDHIF